MAASDPKRLSDRFGCWISHRAIQLSYPALQKHAADLCAASHFFAIWWLSGNVALRDLRSFAQFLGANKEFAGAGYGNIQ